jgi:hypothetical protein
MCHILETQCPSLFTMSSYHIDDFLRMCCYTGHVQATFENALVHLLYMEHFCMQHFENALVLLLDMGHFYMQHFENVLVPLLYRVPISTTFENVLPRWLFENAYALVYLLCFVTIQTTFENVSPHWPCGPVAVT